MEKNDDLLFPTEKPTGYSGASMLPLKKPHKNLICKVFSRLKRT